MSRERHVYPTSEIPHLWAHQIQNDARNPQGNYYFKERTIFSYRDSFPLAALVVGKGGQNAALITQERYSVTTSGHLRDADRAILPGVTRFYLPELTESMLPESDGKLAAHAADGIIEAYQREIKSRAQKAIAAHTHKKIQEWIDSAHAELAELNHFITFFGLPALSLKARIESRKLPFIPPTVDAAKELGRAAKQQARREAQEKREREAAKYREAIESWMAAHPDYAVRWDGTNENAEALATEFHTAERRAAALRQLSAWMDSHADVRANWDGTQEQGNTLRREWMEADQKARNAENAARWLNGENAYYPYSLPTALRIKGGNVETSRGAVFPIAHARRGLNLVRAVMGGNKEWRPNGHTCRLGHYAIDRITPEGTVYAGCHVVEWPAIERIQGQLEKSPAV